MAFPTINAQQEINNRKILEDLQIKKQLLQKAPVGSNITNMPVNNTFMPINFGSMGPMGPIGFHSDMAMNSPARAALTQANNQSFGYFVAQDSAFGNNILPVLPRIDNLTK